MERSLKKWLVVAAVLLILFGGSLGYYLGAGDVQQSTIEKIWERYDCTLRNNFNLSVGGIIAGANESNINMSEFPALH